MTTTLANETIAPVILGCGTFGGLGSPKEFVGRGLDRAAALATMDEAAALGLDVFDTAVSYTNGESELAIGEWLRTRPAAVTAEVHIATKAPIPDRAAGEIRMDRQHLERALATSLERMGVEHVTFFLAHALDDETPIEETVEGFAALLESGRVAHVGCCNVDGDQLRAALEAAERLGVPGFEWVQNGFSALLPDDDREVRTICRERGLGYTPFSPLAGGVLTGKYKRGEPFPPGTRMALRPESYADRLTDATFDALDQLRTAAESRQVSTAALALAWIINHPDCTAPVVGPSRTVPHLGHVAEALELRLEPDAHERIAGWFSGPR